MNEELQHEIGIDEKLAEYEKKLLEKNFDISKCVDINDISDECKRKYLKKIVFLDKELNVYF